MAKLVASGRESGIRAAIAMLRQMHRDDALTASCDPAADEFDPPLFSQRNIVLEYLDRCDRAEIEGFCFALSGYLGIVVAGCVPDGDSLHREFKRRKARDREREIADGEKAGAQS